MTSNIIVTRMPLIMTSIAILTCRMMTAMPIGKVSVTAMSGRWLTCQEIMAIVRATNHELVLEAK